MWLAWATRPNGIVIAPDEEVPLGRKMKVEAHGGIQTRAVLLYQLELGGMEGPCLWKRMETQDV